jgi:Holliday junction resolvase
VGEVNSRQKGARGEREAAKEWVRVLGGSARRGQQFSGSKESPDIVTSHGGIHVEVKRTERGNPYDWLDQARRDAGGRLPVVLHKRNNRKWLLILELEDAPRLAQEIGRQVEGVGPGEVAAPVSGEDLPAPPEADEE